MDERVIFDLGSVVYHKTTSGGVGIVVGIMFTPGAVQYRVAWDSTTPSDHWAVELTKEKSECLKHDEDD